MSKFAGKTAICTVAALFMLWNSELTAGATGLTSILPAAGLGLELEEGQSVKVVKEDVINNAKLNSDTSKASVSTNKAVTLNDTSITLDKEIVEPVVMGNTNEEEMETGEASVEEAESEEEDFTSLVIAQVNDYVNVRDIPDEDGEVVGKLYDKSVGHFIEEKDGWYKITSGNCTGYVKAEYCVTGEDAVELAKEVGVRIATVTTETLFVREDPSLDSSVIGMVPIEDELVVSEELDEWVRVDIEEGVGYVSKEFVTLSTEFVEAESKEEEEARLEKEEREREAARKAAEKAQAEAEAAANVALAGTENAETPAAPAPAASGSGAGTDVANFALQFVGNPYVYGGSSLTNGTDCSGFVMSVYANFGVSLPHSSSADRNVGYDVGGVENAQPGDIVCYSGHVGIYIGNGQIVHASTSRTGIIVSNVLYRQPLCIRRIF